MSEIWMWAMGLAGAIAFFAAIEGLAFKYPTRQYTLSRVIATMGQNFPLSIWICGVFAGGLAVHFFWHWCPFGGAGTG
jgi:hypothetical protein